MVDLGFFAYHILCGNNNLVPQPKAMPLNISANGDSTNISKSVVLTLIATANDKIFFYQGNVNEALKGAGYGISNYSSKNGLREIIKEKQTALDKFYKGGRKEMMVLIKATPEASYENVVKVLDEMTINQVNIYSLSELTDDEKKVSCKTTD